MQQIPRRVYMGEARAALGWSERWMDAKLKAGALPAPRRDPGGRRLWWPADEFAKAVADLNAKSERVTFAQRAPQVAPPAPPPGRAMRRDVRAAR